MIISETIKIIKFAKRTLFSSVTIKNLLQQIIYIGFYSIVLVAITAFFVGFVLALQSDYAFNRNGIEGSVGSVVILALARELGPVLTGMVVSGKVGGSIAAEIGSMVITDQIDAMKVLNVNTYSHLINPRVLASTLTFPILSSMFTIIGSIGGYFCMCYLNSSTYTYTNDILCSIKCSDTLVGIFKSTTFGYVTSIISCFYGYNTHTGSQGVGISVTKSVMVSCVAILTLNSFYTWIFLNW